MIGLPSRHGGKAALLAATLVAAGAPVLAQQAPTPVAGLVPPPAVTPTVAPVQGAEPAVAAPAAPVEPRKLKLAQGTMVRLMVLSEVSSRTSKPGDRFVLRVDEDVTVDGVAVIPTGAKAWGEVVSAKGTGALGKSGALNARLLHVESQNRQIPIQGERLANGGAATDKMVGAILGFGVLGLFMKGNNAKLKGGEIINGYVSSDTLFDAPPLVASASR